jgi:hypothetical protein
MYRSFEELEVWKRGCKLAVELYLSLKDSREFGLRDQMNRAARHRRSTPIQFIRKRLNREVREK